MSDAFNVTHLRADHPTGNARSLGLSGVTATCPACSQDTPFEHWEADVDEPLLIGGKGVATYLQCVQCGWRSSMGARSTGGAT